MSNTDTPTELYQALAAFQHEVPPIHQGTRGYNYTYATLTEIFEVINPLLADHNLGFTQLIEGRSLRTVIFHTETGQSIEGCVNIPEGVTLKGQNEFQTMGSALTYLRRYSISAALGLVTDEDNDAAGKQTKSKKPKRQHKKKKTKKFDPDSARTKIDQLADDVGVDSAVIDATIASYAANGLDRQTATDIYNVLRSIQDGAEIELDENNALQLTPL